MHKTAAALAVLATTALVVLLAALSPLAPGALAATPPVPAACSSTQACLTVATHHYQQPHFNRAGVGRCRKHMELFDTEDVHMGDFGIVCRRVGTV